MATYYSTQQTVVQNQTATQYPTRASSTDVMAKERKQFFDYTSPASGTQPTTGDLIQLCVIPKGCRVVGVFMAFDIMGSATTLSIGAQDNVGATNDDATHYTAATDVHTAAGNVSGANTNALHFGEVPTVDRLVYAKVAGGVMNASVNLRGFVSFIEIGG